MLLFAMRTDDAYAEELADAKALRDDAEEAWRRAWGEDAGRGVGAKG